MNDNATIYYHDIGDYLTREQKLARIKEFGSVGAMLKSGAFAILQPNKHGDWINHRDEGFEELIPLDAEKKFDAKTKSVFCVVSRGFETARDAWIYNCSVIGLKVSIRGMIDFYNSQVASLCIPEGKKITDVVSMDETKIKWSSGLLEAAEEYQAIAFHSEEVRIAL